MPETEIGALLAWSDALVLPYREASQSGVVAAALAAGRPVIATSVGGLREQLRDVPQAVLCEPDADSLARAIGGWLDAPGHIAPAADAAASWRQAASGLLGAIATALPPKPRAVAQVGWPALTKWAVRRPAGSAMPPTDADAAR